MAIKKHKAPPAIDYDPVTGDHPDLSFGIVEANPQLVGQQSLNDILFKRLYPTDRPTDPGQPWEKPTAERWEVMLPRGAPDALVDPQHLAEAYHAGPSHRIRHLAAIATVRFPSVEATYPNPSMPLHDAWYIARGLAQRISLDLQVAALVVLHVPGRSWGMNAPHAHCLFPCRMIAGCSGFGRFVPTLTDPETGRAYLDRMWAEWLQRAWSV